jgi:hypothetical protein
MLNWHNHYKITCETNQSIVPKPFFCFILFRFADHAIYCLVVDQCREPPLVDDEKSWVYCEWKTHVFTMLVNTYEFSIKVISYVNTSRFERFNIGKAHMALLFQKDIIRRCKALVGWLWNLEQSRRCIFVLVSAREINPGMESTNASAKFYAEFQDEKDGWCQGIT